MCGLAPSLALPKNDSVMQSCSNVALSTIRPPKSDSPSPGLSTTPSIAAEYDVRAPARVPSPYAQEGAVSPCRQRFAEVAGGAEAPRARSEGAVRRAARTL